MKEAFVSDLAPDQSITSYFLVCEKETRVTREGKPFLRLELGDRTGTIEARLWDNAEEAGRSFARDDIVKVQARVELYRGKTQLAVDRVRKAEPGEINPADYFPHTKEDIEALWARLAEAAAAMKNPWLRRLVASVLEDPEIATKLRRAPAAKTMHHAYLGGLLEHIVSLAALGRAAAAHYPEVDADLLLAGIVLHDIGKIDELSYDRAIGYSEEGHLLGHILIGLELLEKKIRAIEGFPEPLAMLVEHMLASHHGQLEFGSPRRPLFREAVLLHFLDDMDSKMGAIRTSLASPEGEGNWTGFNAALERRLLRSEQFLAEGNPSAGEPFVLKPDRKKGNG